MELVAMTDAAHFFANTLNPLLILGLFCAGLARRGGAPVWRYWIACGLGIGAAVMLAEAGKYFVVWPGHPSFPSGHESFGVSASACLAVADRRWLWLAAPVCLVLGWALVAAGYHHPADVAAAAILAPWPPIAAFRLIFRRVPTPL